MSRKVAVYAGMPRLLRHRLPLAETVVFLLIVVYCVFFGWLAVMRHNTFASSAMDLGYTDQVVWNTLHGRPLRFSTLEGATTDLPLEQFRRTDTLLAYHVELLLVPLSLVYLIWSDPRALLLLQVAGIAIGAWPVYLLARQHLQREWIGVAFAVSYLLAPALQGAALSDFHASSLTAGLFAYAMYAVYRRQHLHLIVLVIICLLAKEDMSLLVAMLGIYLTLLRGERRMGLLLMSLGLGWFLLCNLVIMPHYNGLDTSPFLPRLAIFGATVRESVANLVADPALLMRWLIRPEIRAYLLGLLASGGYLSLFSPGVLAIASPSIAINVFSAWDWTYSGGEHYSTAIIPFVVVSAIYGMGWLAKKLSAWQRLSYGQAVMGLSLCMLAISGTGYLKRGISPLSERFEIPRVTAHDRLGQEILSMIPPQASVSAQSNLYPHLSQRERAYWYPAVNDADYVMLDVTGTAYPLTPRGLFLEANQLMRSGEYGTLVANDGYLLLAKGAENEFSGGLPAAFYSFARGQRRTPAQTRAVRFGDDLELVGCDYRYLNVVQSHSPPVTITTWWRPLRPISRDYLFVFFFTNDDGAIVYLYQEETATTLWYPSHSWSPGELVRMETPVLTAGALNEILVGVVAPNQDPWQTEKRLTVQTEAGDETDLLAGSTLYRALRLP